jgi:primosomal protein N' (replication factor Y) (superfamily II helicase)
VVRVLPVEAAIDKTFDYLVPESLADQVRVGTMVRVALHGRRVGAWVVADDVAPPAGLRLQPLAKVTGWGPAPEIIDLARWGARRWAGRVATILRTASPDRAVPSLPPPPSGVAPVPVGAEPLVAEALAAGGGVVRLAPAVDRYPTVLAAAALGDALVVTPSVRTAWNLGARLRRAGVPTAVVPRDWARARAGGVTVVGARAAAWAPVGDLAAVVVLDEHDEVHQEERVPTWHARDVALERARRAGVPWVLVSPCPSLEALERGPLFAPSRRVERDGWAALQVVDRRNEDVGRSGLFSPAFTSAVHHALERGPVVCVLNRKGRSRLLACRRCGELARCERCEAAVRSDEEDRLVCGRCSAVRPQVCLACGSTVLRNLRMGVTRAREELGALFHRQAIEVTATTGHLESADGELYVGTEAVLHHVSAAALVAFLDFDQELLAPRYRAAEQAMALLVRAARLAGGRTAGGRVLVQTRLPRHETLVAALHADPERLVAAERQRRAQLRWPPYAALAEISGGAAARFIDEFGTHPGVDVLGPVEGRWLLRAPDHETLVTALADVPRPPASAGRLRIAVDPVRI